jgi:hypothetical protein
MRIFVEEHNISPGQSVQKALDILRKASIYSTGGATIGDRAAVILDAKYVQRAIAALNEAGVRTVIG